MKEYHFVDPEDLTLTQFLNGHKGHRKNQFCGGFIVGVQSMRFITCEDCKEAYFAGLVTSDHIEDLEDLL